MSTLPPYRFALGQRVYIRGLDVLASVERRDRRSWRAPMYRLIGTDASEQAILDALPKRWWREADLDSAT